MWQIWCLGKLIADRGSRNDESTVTNWRTSVARMASEDAAAKRMCFRPVTLATRHTSDDRYPGAVLLTHWNIRLANLKVIRTGTRSQWSCWRRCGIMCLPIHGVQPSSRARHWWRLVWCVSNCPQTDETDRHRTNYTQIRGVKITFVRETESLIWQ